jgi:hypothetical protein
MADDTKRPDYDCVVNCYRKGYPQPDQIRCMKERASEIAQRQFDSGYQRVEVWALRPTFVLERK